METELFALRGRSSRRATPEEIETSSPMYERGSGARAGTGILFIHGFTVTPANFREVLEMIRKEIAAFDRGYPDR